MNDQLLTSGLALWQWRSAAQRAALSARIPVTEVDWLLQEVAGLDRLSLRLGSFKNLPEIQLQLPLSDLDRLWQRRIHERLPVQYIAGATPWRQFKLAVSPSVLIPRPETECLIDLAVSAAQKSDKHHELGHWADLGTGSGAIAIGLAQAMPQATIHAVDCCAAALAVARQNAQAIGYTHRIQFYQGSWWEPLEFLKGQLSGIVSNPPYIPSELVPQLQPEVALHEPWLALDGGVDGLDCIRHLISTSAVYLRPGGIWLIEMMAGQAEVVATLLQNHGSYGNIKIHSDLAGIERFALAYRSNKE
jgi:release factor glutamine methyltransferase